MPGGDGIGNVENIAEEKTINFLGSLELDKGITESGDKGEPFAQNNSKNSESYEKITDKIISFCRGKE